MEPNSLILGIDPGPESSAYCFWDPYLELTDDSGNLDNWDLRKMLLELLELPPSNIVVVIEDIECFGMAVGSSVFMTVRWSGRFQEICEYYGIKCDFLKRSEIKLNLCHSKKAKNPNVRQALIDRYGSPGTKKKPGKLYGVKTHIWSALAVCVTYGDGVT